LKPALQKGTKLVKSQPAKIMAKPSLLVSLLMVLAVLIAFPVHASAQLVLGQYEDEAPLRTWNTFGFQTAPSLGRGEATSTIASDCSVALTNPALLLDLSRFTATLNGTSYFASLHKFSLINTGVLNTNGSPSFTLYALDFGGFSYQFRGWAFAITIALVEIYDRPGARYEYTYQGNLYYTLDFRQKGILRNTNFSIARKLGRLFHIGLGFNLATGDLKRDIVENWLGPPSITISNNISQDFSGFFLNGGIIAKITDRWTAALVFRTPYIKKSESHSKLEYSASGGTDIKIEADSSDTYKQPLVVGAGISYKFSPKFQVFSDLSYCNWSEYKVEYFSEAMERNFKDTLNLGLGAEYFIGLRIFKADGFIPLRIGVVYDPQPMQEPKSAYTYFSAGTGFHWRIIALDLSASFGREKGSGDSLEARRISLSLSLKL
jgi:hypothetical protein